MRVHELAKELGMTNAEMMSLCDVMGVGVKSHSSTLIEAQADRLRRRALKDGLTRDEQPEETKPARKGAKKAASTTKAAAPKADTVEAAPPEQVEATPAVEPASSTNGTAAPERVAPAAE